MFDSPTYVWIPKGKCCWLPFQTSGTADTSYTSKFGWHRGRIRRLRFQWIRDQDDATMLMKNSACRIRRRKLVHQTVKPPPTVSSLPSVADMSNLMIGSYHKIKSTIVKQWCRICVAIHDDDKLRERASVARSKLRMGLCSWAAKQESYWLQMDFKGEHGRAQINHPPQGETRGTKFESALWYQVRTLLSVETQASRQSLDTYRRICGADLCLFMMNRQKSWSP